MTTCTARRRPATPTSTPTAASSRSRPWGSTETEEPYQVADRRYTESCYRDFNLLLVNTRASGAAGALSLLMPDILKYCPHSENVALLLCQASHAFWWWNNWRTDERTAATFKTDLSTDLALSQRLNFDSWHCPQHVGLGLDNIFFLTIYFSWFIYFSWLYIFQLQTLPATCGVGDTAARTTPSTAPCPKENNYKLLTI